MILLLKTVLIILLLNVNSLAQEFYTFLNKSESYLVNKLGTPDNVQTLSTMKAYQYFSSSNENIVYGIKKAKVISAMKGIQSSSLSNAKETVSIQVLYYLSLGFTKQGTEAGMTILKKKGTVINIGYVDNDDGTYSTILTAL